MNILIIGSGGREHAIALKLFEEKINHNLFVSPGNGGTSAIATNVQLDLHNPQQVVSFCQNNKIELVVIGPEQPLVDGLADFLRKSSINVFGPNKLAARIEGDKNFAKQLMSEFEIPTASYISFRKDDYYKAVEYLDSVTYPIVLKASGLAAGKGVIIAENIDIAQKALKNMMLNKLFGRAGDIVVIEEFLEGEELSVFVVTDGTDYIILPPSQDHKRIGEGDTGKNTGGMGAYSPIPFVKNEVMKEVELKVVQPTLKGLKAKDSNFNGCLYCGLINTKEGIQVIEFNCRFGDPEIQAVLQLLDGEFSTLLLSTAKGKVDKSAVKYNGKSAICVVAASGGYPDNYTKGYEIIGIPENTEKLKIIHAGTKFEIDKLFTNGGRVLNIVAISDNGDYKECKDLSYSTLKNIFFENIYYRKDIANRV